MHRRLFLTLVLAGSLPGIIGRAAQPAGGDGSHEADGWTFSQKEHFLLTARVESEESAGHGVTHSQKVILSDGRVTHAAHVQSIDIHMPLFKGKDGSEERDFSDSWKYNVAAYRLAKLLHLADMVPVCVEREIDGRPAAVDWWLDGVIMDERRRLARNMSPPDIPAWNRQIATIRIFDQLIYNVDRSQENLLIAANWKVWMIDHTRSFRKWHTLRDAGAVSQCNPELLRRLKALGRRDVEREMGSLLTPQQIDALFARRDLIVEKVQGNGITAQR